VGATVERQSEEDCQVSDKDAESDACKYLRIGMAKQCLEVLGFESMFIDLREQLAPFVEQLSVTPCRSPDANGIMNDHHGKYE
jgi:hypothetical protein